MHTKALYQVAFIQVNVLNCEMLINVIHLLPLDERYFGVEHQKKGT